MRVHALAPLVLVLAAATVGCAASTLEPAEAPVMQDKSVASSEPVAEAAEATTARADATAAPQVLPGQYEVSFTPAAEPPPAAAPKPRKGYSPPQTTHKKAMYVSPAN